MNEQQIIEFRKIMSKMSKAELKEQKDKLQQQLSQMVLDSDLFMKIAIVEAMIEVKK